MAPARRSGGARSCGAPLRDIVRNTLIHEIGHHFGYSDDDMDRIEFGEE